MLCSPNSSFPYTSFPPSLTPTLSLSIYTQVDVILNAELSKIERRESFEEARLIDLQWKSVDQAEQISTSHAISKLEQSQEISESDILVPKARHFSTSKLYGYFTIHATHVRKSTTAITEKERL